MDKSLAVFLFAIGCVDSAPADTSPGSVLDRMPRFSEMSPAGGLEADRCRTRRPPFPVGNVRILGNDAVANRAEPLDGYLDNVAGQQPHGRLPANPTPPGVPVAITSPGRNRVNDEKNSIALGMSTII